MVYLGMIRVQMQVSRVLPSLIRTTKKFTSRDPQGNKTYMGSRKSISRIAHLITLSLPYMEIVYIVFYSIHKRQIKLKSSLSTSIGFATVEQL